MIDKNKIPQDVMVILKSLQHQGYDSFIVGGAIRDLLLGKDPHDFDICTEANPDQIKKIFSSVIDTGLKFGTVTVINGVTAVEVTTFRKSIDQAFSHSYAEDVFARDFTINGILFDGRDVIDLVGGLKDLCDQRIRAIGNSNERFNEDALRMLRGIRMHCQLGFEIEEDTLNSMIENAKLMQKIAPERIRNELIKILVSEVPSDGIRLLHGTGLLKYILPELDACHGFDQKNRHHDRDIFEHILAVLDYTPTDLALRLAALLHDIGKPQTFSIDEKGIGHFYRHNLKSEKMAGEILKRLRWDKKTINTVSILVREHMSRIQVLRTSTIKKLINRVGVENIYKLIDLQIADIAGSTPPHDFQPMQELRKIIKSIIDNKEPFTMHDLAIGGRELQEIGYQPGPEIGRVLNNLLNYVLADPKMNKKPTLIKLAKKTKNK